MALVVLVLALIPALGGRTWAESQEEEVSPASARDARAGLRTFQRAWRARATASRVAAVEALAACVHEQVADRLVRIVRREDEAPIVRAALEGLVRQKPYADRIVPDLVRCLSEEADAAAKRHQRGDGGFRVDPRTGEADTTSEEGRAHLEAAAARAGRVLALLGTLDELGWEPASPPLDLTPFLHDASDALVVAVLGRLAAWQDVAALPALLDLYRMYPTLRSWETGSVVDLAGTNATAKAAWMVRFGHPDKQRARPEVVEALRAALEAITERAFETPEALAAWLAQDDVQVRLERERRRRR